MKLINKFYKITFLFLSWQSCLSCLCHRNFRWTINLFSFKMLAYFYTTCITCCVWTRALHTIENTRWMKMAKNFFAAFHLNWLTVAKLMAFSQYIQSQRWWWWVEKFLFRLCQTSKHISMEYEFYRIRTFSPLLRMD